MGSRSGGSQTRLRSQGWRELKSSGAGKSLQLTVRSVTAVLILAEFKLLLQNESIRPSRCGEHNPPGTSQPSPRCRGAGSSTHGCIQGGGPAAGPRWSWFIYLGFPHLQPMHPTARGLACRGVLPGRDRRTSRRWDLGGSMAVSPRAHVCARVPGQARASPRAGAANGFLPL